MSLHQGMEKIKPHFGYFLIFTVGVVFFVLGRVSVGEKEGNIPILYSNSTYDNKSDNLGSAVYTLPNNLSSTTNINLEDNQVIGSKSGKKYYFPWCGTVKRIKLENRVYFQSISDAKEAGFTAGGNCKGLK